MLQSLNMTAHVYSDHVYLYWNFDVQTASAYPANPPLIQLQDYSDTSNTNSFSRVAVWEWVDELTNWAITIYIQSVSLNFKVEKLLLFFGE